MRGLNHLSMASLFALGVGLSPIMTHAQVVERHLPQQPPTKPSDIVGQNAEPSNQDATAIGPALKGLVLLGPDDQLASSNVTGIKISEHVRAHEFANATTVDLKPLFGQPISRKLIADVKARIAKRYRNIGYPFVSLVTPEQEITSGVLQVRIVEFHAGRISTKGATDKEAAYFGKRIELKPGDAINTSTLSEDLDWLNRYPFRHVQAVFKPGQTTAASDLILVTDHSQPWQVYGGYANDGSTSTGMDRTFIGATAGNILGCDSVVSIQATGSHGSLTFHGHPAYGSEAVTYTLPVGSHEQIEASIDHVETNQFMAPFGVRLDVNEGSLDYRWALPSTAVTQMDFALGVTAKHQLGTTFFSGINVDAVDVEDYQLFLNFHRYHADANFMSTWDATVHLSPGRIDSGNGNEQTMLYSQGRLKGSTYAYLSASYDGYVPLPEGFAYSTKVYWQVTEHALPRTEQAGLGGSDLVRGYSLDDGAFDTALVVRNDLHLPFKQFGQVNVNPYLFVDAGDGRDLYLKTSTDLVSTGAGADFLLNRAATLHVDLASNLARTSAIKPGSTKLEAALNVRY